MLDLIAKTKPKESIAGHTESLLRDYECFVSMYGSFFTEDELKLIKIACKFHDYGKAIFTFQSNVGNMSYFERIDNETLRTIKNLYKNLPKNIPHGYISPSFLDIRQLENSFGKENTAILVRSIYYHHNRDCRLERNQINEIIQQDILKRYPDVKVQSVYYKYTSPAKEKEIRRDEWLKCVPVLGMLNRLDYHASANLGKSFEISPVKDGMTLGEIVKTTIIQKYESLRPVQIYMMENKEKNLLVTASTGIGKTEAALLWANGDKTFYTLPVKVSINAIYERICKKVENGNGYNFGIERTTLLHSDAAAYLTLNESDNISYRDENDNSSSSFMKYQASRLFSYPVTVCTIDQLFTFVYMYRGCEQLLATLKYSRVVIDEIQSYSPGLVAKILFGLKLISDIGGKFAIITATLPPVIEHFMGKMQIPYEKPVEPFLTQIPRHFISYNEGDFDYEIIREAASEKKVLIICNTIKKAQEVYRALTEDFPSVKAKLLHSHFIQRHRRKLEKRIIEFAENKAETHGVWISTQIVEASLDIDFDVLFTEMCPADNLLQRMGRCYRKRIYEGNIPNVYIFDNKNGLKSVYKHEDIYERSVRFLLKYDNSIFTEDNKAEYINNVYDVDELIASGSGYYKEIKDEIYKSLSRLAWSFTQIEAKNKFRDITSTTIIPLSVYDCNLDEIEQNLLILNDEHQKYSKEEKIRAEEDIRSLTISLSYNKYYAYKKSGLLSDGFNKKLEDMMIYVSGLKYVFDEGKMCGEGLIKGEYFENNIDIQNDNMHEDVEINGSHNRK